MAARPSEPDLSGEPRLQAILTYENDPAHRIQVPARLTQPHVLIEQLRVALKTAFSDRRGLPSPGARALAVTVSEAQRGRALRLLDALIKALERRGYPVRVHDNRTQVDMLGVSLELNLTETTTRRPYEPTARELAKQARGEWVYWPKWHHVPTGKLMILAAQGVAGKISDAARTPVEAQLNALIVAMGRWAVSRLVEREERARLEAERRRQREAAFALKAQQDAERQRLQQLARDARAWQRAIGIRAYLHAMESGVVQAGGLSGAQQQYLAWARAKADWLDPLVRAPDELLDQTIDIPPPGWGGPNLESPAIVSVVSPPVLRGIHAAVAGRVGWEQKTTGVVCSVDGEFLQGIEKYCFFIFGMNCALLTAQ
ncbi:hypothetical protein FQZ97_710190 [compost metagenome]